MICVVICSKHHSLRQIGKCEVFIPSRFLQAIPVPIPIPMGLVGPISTFTASSSNVPYSTGKSAKEKEILLD